MTNLPITVLTVDDHPVMREGIVAVLQTQPDMHVVAEASDGREAVESWRRHRPDVTLMDLQMPAMNGVEAIEAIRRCDPDARIVVLTTYTGDAQIVRALKAGAAGYLLKSSLRTELLDTIRQVRAGRRRMSPAAAQELAVHAVDEPLSAREVQILAEVARGYSNKEIGRTLSITEGTVKSHLKTIGAKLRARDRTHAVTIALQRGMLAH